MPYTATCHCGALSVEVDRLPEAAGRCNCTWCLRTGGLWGYYTPEEVRILRSATERVYAPRQVNTHHFCATCSGMVWNETPKWTADSAVTHEIPEGRQIALNLNMIDDEAVRALRVYEMDGRHGW